MIVAMNRVSIVYEIPLAEIVYEFFDQLKSNTKGYASFDYELIGYKRSRYNPPCNDFKRRLGLLSESPSDP